MPTKIVGKGEGWTDKTYIIHKIDKPISKVDEVHKITQPIISIEEGKFSGYVYNSTTGKFEYIDGYINSYSYTYDANGNMTEMTLEIVDENGNVIATIRRTYTYDANNNLVEKSRWEVV